MTPALTLFCDADILKKSALQSWLKASGLDQNEASKDAVKESWKGLVWPLSFFEKSCYLAELTNDNDAAMTRHYLIKIDDDITKAQFGHNVVEALVEKAGLALDAQNIADYLAFYLGFTRGQAGRLFLINTVDDLPLREELTIVLRRNIQNLITPLRVLNAHQVEACFLIQDKLFKAKATIEENGSVLLEPSDILADTLPIQDTRISA